MAWLDSRHSFSFGHYHDPKQMGFGPLRVINDDRVSPGAGFGAHSHANMEILSYVLEGGLEHKDSLGNGSVIVPGDIQRMSAGTGITHSEFNASKTEAVRFLQIWIIPDRQGVMPSYEQKHFDRAELGGQLRLIVDPEGGDGAVSIHQDVQIFAGILAPNHYLKHAIAPDRRAWIQVARGALTLNGNALQAGDGAAIQAEAQIELRASEEAEILLLDLP